MSRVARFLSKTNLVFSPISLHCLWFRSWGTSDMLMERLLCTTRGVVARHAIARRHHDHRPLQGRWLQRSAWAWHDSIDILHEVRRCYSLTGDGFFLQHPLCCKKDSATSLMLSFIDSSVWKKSATMPLLQKNPRHNLCCKKNCNTTSVAQKFCNTIFVINVSATKPLLQEFTTKSLLQVFLQQSHCCGN